MYINIITDICYYYKHIDWGGCRLYVAGGGGGSEINDVVYRGAQSSARGDKEKNYSESVLGPGGGGGGQYRCYYIQTEREGKKCKTVKKKNI